MVDSGNPLPAQRKNVYVAIGQLVVWLFNRTVNQTVTGSNAAHQPIPFLPAGNMGLGLRLEYDTY